MTEDPQPQDAPARRSSVREVLGVAGGLVVLALAAWVLATSDLLPLDGAADVRAIDGEALLQRSFAPGELPYGMVLEGALALGDREVLAFRSPDDDREDSTTPLEDVVQEYVPEPGAELEESTTEREAREDLIDWPALHEEESGTPPSHLFLVHHSFEDAESAIRDTFRSEQGFGSGSRGGGRGGHRRGRGGGPQPGAGMMGFGPDMPLVLEGGKLKWGEFGVDFQLERRWGETPDGPAFRDAIRINLSRGRECWIAHAHWPTGYPGSTEVIEELLAALPPREQ